MFKRNHYNYHESLVPLGRAHVWEALTFSEVFFQFLLKRADQFSLMLRISNTSTSVNTAGMNGQRNILNGTGKARLGLTKIRTRGYDC
ncbi:MAG TPA: hypothetical protein VE955_10170 [Candidatus Dormibacteraeota bacterium]|jgi:hypothetical protein|nr:hypothetical protein [Candidatus Dormibacteraeota bacterium]